MVAIREPMPYGDLVKQNVMRFEKYEDLDKYDCTIEEREEYEPYIEQGLVIYSGVDYEKIIREAEKEADVIKKYDVDEVVFAYSDVSHQDVMHKGSIVLAAGANYRLISGKFTQIKAKKPVVAVCAVRTGCGKSQVSRATYRYLKNKGFKVVAIREPMPYGDLVKQNVMRFEKYEDLDKYDCTIEEREEYEPYIEQGLVIYSGVDYEKIIREAEKEADVIIFDGGNNEISFYVPDLLFIVVDPLRPGHEILYHPGEVNARYADAYVINKMNNAKA
ncbi:unnamed protein product, partial [marine sediment metagenome]